MHTCRKGNSLFGSNLAYSSTCLKWCSVAALVSTRNSASRYWREGEGGEGCSEGRKEGGRYGEGKREKMDEVKEETSEIEEIERLQYRGKRRIVRQGGDIEEEAKEVRGKYYTS